MELGPSNNVGFSPPLKFSAISDVVKGSATKLRSARSDSSHFGITSKVGESLSFAVGRSRATKNLPPPASLASWPSGSRFSFGRDRRTFLHLPKKRRMTQKQFRDSTHFSDTPGLKFAPKRGGDRKVAPRPEVPRSGTTWKPERSGGIPGAWVGVRGQ